MDRARERIESRTVSGKTSSRIGLLTSSTAEDASVSRLSSTQPPLETLPLIPETDQLSGGIDTVDDSHLNEVTERAGDASLEVQIVEQSDAERPHHDETLVSNHERVDNPFPNYDIVHSDDTVFEWSKGLTGIDGNFDTSPGLRASVDLDGSKASVKDHLPDGSGISPATRASRRRERRNRMPRPPSKQEPKVNVDTTTLKFMFRDSPEIKVVLIPRKVSSYSDLQTEIARQTYRNNRFFVVQDMNKRLIT